MKQQNCTIPRLIQWLNLWSHLNDTVWASPGGYELWALPNPVSQHNSSSCTSLGNSHAHLAQFKAPEPPMMRRTPALASHVGPRALKLCPSQCKSMEPHLGGVSWLAVKSQRFQVPHSWVQVPSIIFWRCTLACRVHPSRADLHPNQHNAPEPLGSDLPNLIGGRGT